MNEYEKFFKSVFKKFNKIVIKKAAKYPMLDIEKIRRFLLTWTKHHMTKGKNLKESLYLAIITFKTTCNLAIAEKAKGK